MATRDDRERRVIRVETFARRRGEELDYDTTTDELQNAHDHRALESAALASARIGAALSLAMILP